MRLGTGATGYVGTTSWGTANITVPAAYAGTTFRLVFQWRNDGSGGSNPPIAIDDVSLVSSCTGAVTAAATAIGTTTATLNAVTLAGATGYNFRYRVVGSPSWTIASGNPYAGTSAAITGLTPSSNYEFQVAAAGPVCNAWSASRTFTTLCTVITSLPWTEGFEGVGTVGAGVFPNCWSYVNVTGTNTPGTYGTTDTYRGPRTGSNHAYTQYSTTAWTFTPSFTLTAGVSYDFSFYMMNKSVTSPIDFVMDVAYGTSATDAGMTNVLQTGYSATNSSYSQFKYTFTPASSGDYFFGYKSTSPSSTPWYLSFDDFKLELSPACISPTANSASNVTNSSADYNFTCTSCSGNYIVEYGLNGFTPGTAATAGTGGTVISTSTLTGTISGLAALTGYQYYVRQICAGPVYGTNAGPVSFTTTMDCSTAIPISGCATNFTVTTTAATGAYNPPSTSCGFSTPGEEKLYTFTPTISGIHTLSNVSGATGGYLDVFIKAASGGCGGTGWTCINDYSTTVEANATPSLTAGTQYYLLFDGESAAVHNQTFFLDCPIPPPANDDCASATAFPTIPNTGACASVTVNNAGATQSLAGCIGTADDDMWYSFTVPAGQTTINYSTTDISGSGDRAFQLFDACAGTSLFCNDSESGSFTGLTSGNTYILRTYSYFTASPTSFSLCLSVPPPPPANDDCATAVSINPDFTCTGASSVSGTIQGATNSGVASATGTADDDVWYSFIAENTTQIITLTNPNFTDFVTQVFSGSCGSLTSLGYYDTDPSNLSITGLTIGDTYYIRVYSYSNGTFFTNPNAQFSLCVQNPPPPPANDECAGAIAFPSIPNSGACASVTVNTAGATQSLAGCSGTADDDVWYTFVVPAGNTSVNYSTSNITGDSDRMFQLFDACAGTSLFCNDNESGTFSGLTSGNTYVLRTYTYSSGAVSNFSLCLSITPPPPANDNCATAKPLVSCGAPDSISLLTGATQSLVAGSCGGTAGDDVWYSFVADATTMYVTVKGFNGYDAVVELRGGACNGTELFCSDNTFDDDFEDITATGLTIGQTYYIRVFDWYTAAPGSIYGFWIQVGPGGCWQGGNSSDWSDAGNWNNFSVPNSCASNVIIPAGTPNAPAITTANYTVGNVNIASGVNLTLTGNNLNVCGNWAAGTGSNAVTVGTGRVILQGTGSQTITGNTRFESLTINSVGGSYTNTGIVEIASRLRPQSGALTNSGTLHFLSTSATDIATINLTVGNTGTISGNIIADRFVPVSGSNQHYVSSPIDNLPLSQLGASGGSGFVVPTPTCDETVLATGSPYGTVFRYNEANGASCSLAGWEVMGGGNADNSRGYSAYLTGAGAPLSVTGAPNMAASYSLSGLTNTGWTNTTLQGRTQNGGWSLVGNPYLSTVNLAAKAGLDAQAQVWQTSGPYAGTYQAVIMGGGSAFVAPFQGFMVHKTTVGGTATFDIGRTECVNSTSTFYKTGNSNGTLSLKISGNGYNDVTTIAFDAQATNQFDVDKDANKLPGRLVQPMIASKVGNDKYSINTLESISTNPTVDVEFMAGTNGNFTITADDLSTFDPTVMVYLEDKITKGAWKNLRQSNTYSFSGNVADSEDRFVLHFTPAAYINTEDAVCEKGGVISMEQEGDVKWMVEVKNTATQAIAAKAQPLNATNALTLNNIPVGTYDIVLTSSNGYVATKTVTINGTNAIVAHYTSSSTAPTVNQTVAFNSFVNQAATLSWNFGDGSTSTIANPNHIYTTPGIYTVVLKAINSDGCEATFAQTITVADVTGIGNVNTTGKEISMYVNSEKNLNITFVGYKAETANIQVFNIIGQEILNAKHNTGTKFVHEINQVEAAYLIVKVTIAGQTTTKKVLITKE
ncbi:MAG: PKD domain-containing protein [Chitinophagales bacterium]|nr:PKD domain-containing protein [Chitinophagales bacterium]